jgi:hypothetical protein
MSEYIVGIESEHTGGGCMVDFIILKNGQVICVSCDYVGLYNSIEDVFGEEDLCINGFSL